MELFIECLLIQIGILLILQRNKVSAKKRKNDQKMIELQGIAFSLLLQEFKEVEAYDMKPLNATSEQWWYVVNTVYNPAPAFANPF